MKKCGAWLACAGALVLCPAVFASPTVAHRAPGRATLMHKRSSAPSAAELEALSRTLKEKKSAWAYSKLGAIAKRQSSGVAGIRAAFALGAYDYAKGNYGPALDWFQRTREDPLLGDYSLYWIGETKLALNQSADAVGEFKQLLADYPHSVMAGQALQSLAAAAFAAHEPADAIAALNAYPGTPADASLLFLRGQAYEQANQPLQAAADYQAVFLKFPASEKAREAGVRLDFLAGSLGSSLPVIPLPQRLGHAAMLYHSSDWGAARDEYSRLVPQLSGADLERAELRILECGVQLGGSSSGLITLHITDPDVSAERLYDLADYYRSAAQDSQMASTIEQLASEAPASQWTEQAYFLGGNYFWVQLDRDAASQYYARVADQFPNSPDAIPAQWRVAWTAALKRDPSAASLLSEHVRRFPGSPFTPDALYWLGRLAEEAKNPSLARAYYKKLAERFPRNYFSTYGESRLPHLRSAPDDPVELLSKIPPVPAAPRFNARLTSATAGATSEYEKRAAALRSIAFDASAEMELRAGYDSTRDPRLLLEAAEESVRAGNCGAAILSIRQLYPELNARPFNSVPRDAWLAAYALPFEPLIRKWSRREGLDPMLVAGLIHQESAFQPDAHSYADAFGLMQLIPDTARQLARQAGLRYSEARLFEPDYNIRLGTLYLADLKKQFGNIESVLAVYNAGPDRVAFWQGGQQYREPAEFVDSIPFTETRDYVEIITRNAQIYRKLYGAAYEPRSTAARRKR